MAKTATWPQSVATMGDGRQRNRRGSRSARRRPTCYLWRVEAESARGRTGKAMTDNGRTVQMLGRRSGRGRRWSTTDEPFAPDRERGGRGGDAGAEGSGQRERGGPGGARATAPPLDLCVKRWEMRELRERSARCGRREERERK
ncbi:hypothetical protein E2562_036032 [Oryza meyeriana var. granulata]|uniref:DUF834 domain-containing protein n=1 Tax=Oryza meyeriana var. granulata TaxID=110450 RepID=A0A6G1CX47_9ORYZ|nr:hypothetical protein E2562_036032 [Oryza meyeriana var. granulata]